MWKSVDYNNCVSFIEIQYHPKYKDIPRIKSAGPATTIRRMRGAKSGQLLRESG